MSAIGVHIDVGPMTKPLVCHRCPMQPQWKNILCFVVMAVAYGFGRSFTNEEVGKKITNKHKRTAFKWRAVTNDFALHVNEQQERMASLLWRRQKGKESHAENVHKLFVCSIEMLKQMNMIQFLAK